MIRRQFLTLARVDLAGSAGAVMELPLVLRLFSEAASCEEDQSPQPKSQRKVGWFRRNARVSNVTP